MGETLLVVDPHGHKHKPSPSCWKRRQGYLVISGPSLLAEEPVFTVMENEGALEPAGWEPESTTPAWPCRCVVLRLKTRHCY